METKTILYLSFLKLVCFLQNLSSIWIKVFDRTVMWSLENFIQLRKALHCLVKLLNWPTFIVFYNFSEQFPTFYNIFTTDKLWGNDKFYCSSLGDTQSPRDYMTTNIIPKRGWMRNETSVFKMQSREVKELAGGRTSVCFVRQDNSLISYVGF